MPKYRSGTWDGASTYAPPAVIKDEQPAVDPGAHNEASSQKMMRGDSGYTSSSPHIVESPSHLGYCSLFTTCESADFLSEHQYDDGLGWSDEQIEELVKDTAAQHNSLLLSADDIQPVVDSGATIWEAQIPNLLVDQSWNGAAASALSTSNKVQKPPGKGLSGARSTGRDRPSCCSIDDCRRTFSRPADLDRHKGRVHGLATEVFFCDYSNCERGDPSKPVGRMDHYREHLREFHKEDIPKRNKEPSLEWLEERIIRAKWWRCTRCLQRVFIKGHGFTCPTCMSNIEEPRRIWRCRGDAGC